MCTIHNPNGACLVHPPFFLYTVLSNQSNSFLPESPRYLISKDRHAEAFEILAYYHAECDRDSVFAKAEMAQIETTIKLELEAANLSWWDMVRSPGMRRRTFIAMAMGLYTQWSGNTLISYDFLFFPQNVND
jgi:hypothetical protein